MIPRLIAPLLALVAAGLVVTAALLAEFEVSAGVDVGIVPLDPDRPAFVASVIGILVQVGLLLGPAVMLALGESRGVAGGVLLGTAVLGLSLRGVRLAQLVQTPGVDPAVGSWVDLLAEAVSLSAAVLALSAIRARHPADPETAEP